MYDSSGKGYLLAVDLQKCPPLKQAFDRIDANHDGKLALDELAARHAFWTTPITSSVSPELRITYKGHPLTLATVRLEPDPCMGEGFVPVEGKTDLQGVARPKVDAGQPVSCGLYLVRVSKHEAGRETIPAKYNSQSELGCEIAMGDRAHREVLFELN
jgi:hypothetical protein